MKNDNKSKDIRRINCTQCAAPLSLHGGHKVSSLTCGFCGSVMAAHADFAILKLFWDWLFLSASFFGTTILSNIAGE